MQDELLATPEPEAVEETATPTEEATDVKADAEDVSDEAVQEVEGDETEADEQETDESDEETEASTVEFEADGETFEVPKKLESYLLRDKDYRQKTQAVADQRREVEATQEALKSDRETFETTRDTQLAVIDDMAELRSAEAALKQYENLNWDQLRAQDPDAHQEHFSRFMLLKENRNDVANRVTAKQQEATEQAQQDFAKRLGQAREFAANEIPNWGPGVEQAIVEYGKGIGVTANDIRSVAANNPATLAIIHKAMKYDQLLEKQRAKPKPKPVKPVTKVGGGGRTQTGPSDKDDIKTWMKKRDKQTGQ